MKWLRRFPLLLRNIVFSILADFFLHLGNALVLVLISRELGSTAAGSINIGNTYFYFGTFLAYWGFGNLLTREVAKDRLKFPKYFTNLGATRVIFGVITALLLIGLALITSNYTSVTKIIIVILALGLPVNSLANLCQSAFNSFEKFEIPSGISVVVMLVKLILAWLSLRLLTNPLVWIAVTTMASNLLTLLLLLTLMNRHLPKSRAPIEIEFIRGQIKTAYPFFLMAIFVATDNRIDILLISRLLDTESVGYYSAMTTILGILYLFPDALRNAVLPALARYQQVSPDLMRSRFHSITKYSLLLTIPIAMLGYAFSGVVISWVYGARFEFSATLLRISIGSLISYSIMTIYTRLLVIEGKEKQVMKTILISALVTIFLNFTIARSYGLQGVAFVKLFTSVLLMLLNILIAQNILFRQGKTSSLMWILLSGLMMACSLYFTQTSSLMLQAMISLVIYFIALIILPVFNQAEKLTLIKLIKSLNI